LLVVLRFSWRRYVGPTKSDESLDDEVEGFPFDDEDETVSFEASF
jgi:hypothetical protein